MSIGSVIRGCTFVLLRKFKHVGSYGIITDKERGINVAKYIVAERCGSVRYMQHKSDEASNKVARSTSIDKDKRWIDVSWTNGTFSSYPFVWLRDNCQCPKCFHPTARSRTIIMADLDTRIEPIKAEVEKDGNIRIMWSDGHVSSYHPRWLQDRAFSDEAQQKRNEIHGQKHKFWGSELANNIPKFDFNSVITKDENLLDWLLAMELYGLCILQNTPSKTGELSKLSKRICFARKTNYGEFFEVKSKIDPSNAAYTNVKLGLHADLPFYKYVPGIQFLHCIINEAVGGESLFSDASYAAQIIEKEHPDMYKLLCTIQVDFNDIGSDFYKFHKVDRKPIFVRDMDGNVLGVCYNNIVRDSFLNVPVEDVQPVYDALKKFDDILNSPKNCISYKLNAGDIACFDNIRVLHGRKQYDVSRGGSRHLQGMYVDWDEVNSRIRVLKADLGHQKR